MLAQDRHKSHGMTIVFKDYGLSFYIFVVEMSLKFYKCALSNLG